MSSWEKACPTGCANGYWPRIFSEDLPCSTCHGTGYVPMTTSEMLEALPNGSIQVWKWMDGTYSVWLNMSVIHSNKYPTPDDALRAALEAVNA